MPQMPDKEFDQLFRDKFTDAEIEPSTNLWASIEEKLEPKRKKVFPIYWMAAAVAVIAFAAMLLLQKEEKMKLHGKSDVIAKVVENEQTDLPKVESKNTTENVVANKVLVNAEKAKIIVKQPVENNLKNFDVALQPSQPNNHLPVKQTDIKPVEKPLNNEVMIAQVEPQKDLTENVIGETETVERKGIRNVGDLVNFVVDKVDKRENKLIKFNTDDDDNSSIIGINIGFVKLNKKHR
jgi:hypothetical protein